MSGRLVIRWMTRQGTAAVEYPDRRIKHGEAPRRMASVGILHTTVSTCLVKRFSAKPKQ